MSETYFDKLNRWHLDLAILQSAVDHLVSSLEESEGVHSTARVLSDRFDQLVQSCPFPPKADAPLGAAALEVQP